MSSLGSPFWRLFISSATSNIADGVGKVALPLLASTITRDPVLIAGLGAVLFLPWLLFALPSGALIDRMDRRLAMAFANGFRAVALLALATTISLGLVNIVVLYVAAFALGVAETVYDSAARAILPQVVRNDQLDRGNSLMTAEEAIGQTFIGAPIGSLLIALAVAAPFFTNAAGFAIAALLVLSLRGGFKHPRTQKTTVRADMREGVAWLWQSNFMRNLTAISGTTGILQTMPNALFVLYALENLGLSEAAFGLLLVAAGIGGIAAGLIAPALGRRFGRTTCLTVSAAVGPLGMGAMGLTSSVPVAAVLFALSAGAVTVWNVLSMSIRQVLIPQEIFGRVQGAYRTVIWGAIPVGAMLGGIFASLTSVPTVFIVCGALGALLAYPTWRMMRANAEAIAAAYAAQPTEANA